jgi:Ca-activated chloride channel homolog
MTARKTIYVLLSLVVMASSAKWMWARQNPPSIHVSVEMVQLDVAVTDRKGNYVSDLKPSDFVVYEDGIAQKMAMFGEGDSPPRQMAEIAEGSATPAAPQVAASAPAQPTAPVPPSGLASGDDSPLAGASVFVLFDTSNYMYRGFVFAQDAISNFVRSLQGPDRIALYSYSRNLFRASLLTPDRSQVLRSVRTTVAGDSAALYDSMLVTLRDAQQYSGRRVIVVFSNGPDSSSLAPPEDVEELAQSEGVAIYMISTRQAEMEPLSTKVFERISTSTGGESFFAKNWTEEEKAFSAIREDLGHLYSLYYYPEPNPNRGWRAITVKLPGSGNNKFKVRTRSGYRPLPARSDAGAAAGN